MKEWMERNVNIRDIAKLAGVSASTVSKVMNGRDKDISKETRERVLQIIEEKHYVPYSRFLDKKGIQSRMLGLIVRKNNKERETIVLAAERIARSRGYALLISYAESGQETEKAMEEMRNRNAGGILIDTVKRLSCKGKEMAVVYLNETEVYDGGQSPVVRYFLSEAAKLAAERLLEAGHRKIACIVSAGEKDIVEGYKLALEGGSQSVKSSFIYEIQTNEEIEKCGLAQVLSENVTALVCGSPEIACYMCRVLERIQTSVPGEMSIISVGDNRMLELSGGGITAVKLPADKMAELAVEYLTDQIQKKEQTEVQICLQSSLVERNSIAEPAKEKQGAAIVVVGSMNLDVMIECRGLPVSGKTQSADEVYTSPGGKGANQAVGVGKLGGRGYMIGRLGNDADGKQIYAKLLEHQVHMEGVVFDSVLSSGKAYIHVDSAGESAITVYPGANKNLSANQINRYRHLFDKAKYCLLSLEIPEEAAEYTINLCKHTGTEVILKPSVTNRIKEELFSEIAYFVPNEKELRAFVPGRKGLEEKAEALRKKGVKNVIVTLGAEGCYLQNEEKSLYFEGTGVVPVDTTGGADSFISALAVCLSEGKDLLHAIEFAVYASGICVTGHGVQKALPNRRMVDAFEDIIYTKYEEKRSVQKNDEKNCSSGKSQHGSCH